MINRWINAAWLAAGLGAPGWAQALAPAAPLLPPVAAAAKPQAQLRIERIEVRGNTVLAPAAIDALTQPYTGRVCTLAELEALRLAMTRLYTDGGYVNSGVLLPEEIVDGVLVLTAIEGKLTAVQLNGMGRLDDDYVRRRLAPAPQEVLNLDQLRERFQLLLADPLFERLNARMLPSEKAGEAILAVDATRARPYQFSVFANNYRPVAIGSEALGATALVRNLSGQGDVLDAGIQGSPHKGHGLRGSLGWQMPLGQAGTVMTLAIDAGSSSVVEEPISALDIRSRLRSTELGIQQRFVETLRRKLVAGVSILRRDNRTWLLDQPFSFVPGEPDGHTSETVLRLWTDHVHRSATDVLAVRATLSAGRNNLQQIAGLPPTRTLARRFQLLQGQLQYGRQVLDNGAQLVLRGTAQYSADRLLALDAMAIGGINSVRGYRENQLVRDRGVVLNVEFEYPMMGGAADQQAWTLLPFADYGHGMNIGEAGVSLSSLGVASRYRWRGLSLDVALARRISKPAGIVADGHTLQDNGIHMQLSYKY